MLVSLLNLSALLGGVRCLFFGFGLGGIGLWQWAWHLDVKGSSYNFYLVKKTKPSCSGCFINHRLWIFHVQKRKEMTLE
ncbi:hypothetical protein XELAEV_18045053mg [Xenopus laevis]|uniref:Uncharacterized protein n=1 Tax=Xenopus laevis TaxID=8355 RepID=A0A974C098_XENLA|nr:hypothetical protein XELAEV_18045053mg [Xenopus laevis]